ncbi:type II secretion system F family protein [Bremerella cremea]|uniref:type II secretion system F family protein n=1 Tax=Bremerella cremea TaxID=1031537 RepID=UPI0031EADEB2
MLFSPRISTDNLVRFCRRIGNQFQAGVDVRRIFQREGERASGTQRRIMLDILELINEGTALPDAIDCTGKYFPKLFRQMVRLGDETGKLGTVFLEMADQYEQQVTMRRTFVKGVTWPLLQLIVAILIVGALILVLGFLPKVNGKPIDVLGLGLIGMEGLAIYFSVIGMIIFFIFWTYILWTRGNLSFLQLDRVAMSIPVLGSPIRTLCLQRMSWAMAITIGGGMEIRRAMRLSLEATHSRYYMQFADQVDRELLAGEEIHDILRRTGSFPVDFLDVVETGEISGMLAESMDKLASLYQEKAKAALHTLTVMGGMLVGLIVSGLIIMVIFRLFGFYIGQINDVLENPLGDPRR